MAEDAGVFARLSFSYSTRRRYFSESLFTTSRCLFLPSTVKFQGLPGIEPGQIKEKEAMSFCSAEICNPPRPAPCRMKECGGYYYVSP